MPHGAARPVSSLIPSQSPPVPLEIALHIIQLAYQDDSGSVDTSLLRACSLVCWTWSSFAQRLLFRNVSIRSQRSYSSFRQAVCRSSLRGRALGDAVNRLDVTLDQNQPSPLSSSSFAHAVSLCPNLVEVALSLYGRSTREEGDADSLDTTRMRRAAPSFDENCLQLLGSGPQISALQFSNWSDTSVTLLRLLTIWPSLKSLSITGNPPVLPSPSSEPFPCALNQLYINVQHSPSLIFYKWLLHHSIDSLHTLHFTRITDAHIAEYLLDTFKGTLQHVSLPASSNAYIAALQGCEHLKRLHVERSNASPVAFRRLSSSLEHISFGVDKDSSLLPVLETVKSKPLLKSVTILAWGGGRCHPQLAPLQIACASRGLALRLTEDAQTFRALTVRLSASCFPSKGSLSFH